MKYSLTFILILFSFSIYSQEGIDKLRYNSKLNPENLESVSVQKKSTATNEEYIYIYDTIYLPFLDDFSTDKFTPVPQTTDPNVSSETFYKIMIGGTPDRSGRNYVGDTTYLIKISINSDGDFVKDSIPNPTITLDIYDLTVYPPTFQTVSAWTDTTFIDSVFTTTSPDFYFVYNSNYSQDSLIVYTVSPPANAANYVWKDRFVYRSNTRGISPPTVGVATFDATDDFGIPYDINNVAKQGLADELTSKNLRLSAYIPSDSLYLSFYYQYQGNGDSPESEDYLELEFWSPLNKQWNSIWKSSSINSSAFEQVMIPIKDNQYFFDGFQFRFKNYATLSGSLDHWHLDYVYLAENRAFDDSFQSDVAHRYQIGSMLKDYTSVPWEHYVANSTGLVTDNYIVTHFNANDQVESYEDNVLEVQYNGVIKHTILGPTIIPDFLPLSEISNTYNPVSSGVGFDSSVDPYYAIFDVKSYYTHAGDFNLNNDTVLYQQKFINYYAYDDASAEYAYYVLDKNALIAQKVKSIVEDTLRAVQIHFEPVAFNAQSVPFYITVWAADGEGGAPGTILHQNVALSKPKYIGFKNDGFVEYALDKNLILPAGEFYIGIQQASEIDVRINIGFDIHQDNSDKIYYNIDGDWFNTSLEGTLMLRAVFKTGADHFFLSVEEPKIESLSDLKDVSIYPNPFIDKINIFASQKHFNYQLYDAYGKLIQVGIVQNEINLSNLTEGLYVLRLIDNNQNVFTKKVIKQ